MKTFALLFALTCASVALLGDSAEAGSPGLNLKPRQLAPNVLRNPGTNIGINPQPLPPRVFIPRTRINPGSKIGINPQPLPPRF